jgi:hypothetical protein
VKGPALTFRPANEATAGLRQVSSPTVRRPVMRVDVD